MKHNLSAKKNLIAFATIIATVMMTALPSFAANVIAGWEETLPVSEQDTALQIENKVADLTFKDEDIYMGGQAWDYKLIDVYTFEDHDGSLTYNLRVQYHASMTLDWGKTETSRECQSLVVVDPKLNFSVGPIECRDMQTEAVQTAR